MMSVKLLPAMTLAEFILIAIFAQGYAFALNNPAGNSNEQII
jgi:hypothetical protein